jgi:hypothetical protein
MLLGRKGTKTHLKTRDRKLLNLLLLLLLTPFLSLLLLLDLELSSAPDLVFLEKPGPKGISHQKVLLLLLAFCKSFPCRRLLQIANTRTSAPWDRPRFRALGLGFRVTLNPKP